MSRSRFHDICKSGFFLWLGLLLAGCTSEPATPVPTTPGISLEITADNCPAVTVQAGNQVVWTSNDANELAVHAEDDNGVVLFDSGVLRRGDAFSYFFSEEGTYAYRCAAGSSLSSTITVAP